MISFNNLKRIFEIILIYLVFTNMIAFAGSLEDNVVTNTVIKDRKTGWLNLDYGFHTYPITGYGNTRGIASYGKIMIEIPLESRIGLAAFADIWLLGHHTHNGIGFGMNFITVRSEKIDLLLTPCIFSGDGLGFLFPATIGYRIFDDKIRLQTSVAVRSGAEFNPSGGNSHIFFTVSAGIGFNMTDILPRNNTGGRNSR